MKKLLPFFLLFALVNLVACADKKKAEKTDAASATEKVTDPSQPAQTPVASKAVTTHACGADCKDGHHTYAHNEVGHTCTAACGVAHACTDQCKDGQHMYAHNEVGHTCTEACLKL